MRPDDIGRSVARIWKRHDRRARESGYHATPPGRRLIQKMLQPLLELVIAERRDVQWPVYEKAARRVERQRGRRRKPPRDILDAIKHIDHFDVADRILRVAVSLVYDPSLGRSKKKGTRNAARIIGQNLDQDNGPMAFRVGCWAIELLKELPDGFKEIDGELELPLIEGAGLDLLMTDTMARNAFQSPYVLPSHFAPKPWTDFDVGGLHSPNGFPQPELVITHGKKAIENAVRGAIRNGRMRPFLRAVNSLQATACLINQPIQEWADKFGLTTSSFTDIETFGKPKKREKWWQGSEPRKEIDRQATFCVAMHEARIVSSGGRFFVPLHADTRGRLYGISHFWFGREDYIRGLFLFADGERIGDDGLIWLKAHVARCADGWHGEKTKHLNLEERAGWAEANIERLSEVAEAVKSCEPLYDLPDDPIQFLAAAHELIRINNNPDAVTQLPVTFDCTCSGLQHLSALTRCEEEGRLANLIPGRREDLYQVVADKTAEKRKVVKMPCVSFFFGSAPGRWLQRTKTNKKGKEEVEFYLTSGMIKELIKHLKDLKMSTKGVTRRTHAIYKAIGKTVPQAKKTRAFLNRLAKLLADKNKMLSWESACGLPILSFYFEPIRKRTKIRISRAEKSAVHIVGYDTDNPTTQAHTSAAANFVHSLDASHMHLVALAAAREGIAMLSVHDSFSCLASRARRFKQIIGEQFTQLYARDLLEDILQSAKRELPEGTKMPKLPKKGTLDLSMVPLSFFACS